MANLSPLLQAAVAAKPAKADGEPPILRRIAGNVLSPLAMAGNVLDLPWSSGRDIIGGLATGDWKTFNPIDQWGTPTQDVNRIGGRDLLTRLGLTKPNDPHRWEWEDLAGIAVDFADPLMFVTGVGKGLGTAARGIGKAENLFRLGIPFTDASVGVGKGAAKLIDKVAKKAWDTDIGKTLSTGASGLFDYTTKGSFSPQGQKYARLATEMEETAEPAARQLSLDTLKSLDPMKAAFHTDYDSVLQAAGKDSDEAFRQLLMHSVELASPKSLMSGKSYTDAMTRAAADLGLPAPSPGMISAASGPLQNIADTFFKSHTANYERGVKARYTPEQTGYFTREISKERAAEKGADATAESLFSAPHMKHRDQVIGQVPKLYLDQLLEQKKSAGTITDADVLAKAGEFLGYQRRVKSASGKTKLLDVTPDEHAKKLADKINGTKDLKSFHSDDHYAAIDRYVRASSRIQANADAVHAALKDAVRPTGVPLRKAYNAIGLDGKRAVEWYAKQNGMTPEDAAKLLVDPQTVAAIAKVRKLTENPEWLGFLGNAIDKFNRMFKSSVTVPWPSFNIRNRLSGLHMNVASEHFNPTPHDIKLFWKSSRQAAKAWKEGPDSAVFQEAVVNGMAPDNFAREGVELTTGGKPNPAFLNPIKALPEAWQQAQKHVADNPQGVWPMGLDAYLPKTARQVINTPVQWGSNAARATEFQNRMEMYLFLKAKGMTPKQAATEVNRLHFDYGKATPFERNVAKRLVPFYTFQKSIVPQIGAMLAERPGGGIAQSIRASTAGRDENTVTPPHIADSAALPLGTSPDGTQRFLSNFGLAPEAALPYLAAPADLRGAGLQALSSLTPAVKFPLELATGQTFFQRGPSGGRPLNQLDASVGRTIANVTGADNPVNILGDRGWSRFAEHALANSPLSKLITSARQATDPRKDIGTQAVNLLSPAKITDVSPQQQERAITEAAASLADELGAKTWTNRYFPKEMIEAARKTNPQAAEQMIALDNLMRKAKRDAKNYRDETGKAERKKPAPKNDSERVVREFLKMAGV